MCKPQTKKHAPGMFFAACGPPSCSNPAPTKKRNETRHTAHLISWWERVDSNHRSRRQQIYSLPPLATRERSPIQLSVALLKQVELVDGLEPPTC